MCSIVHNNNPAAVKSPVEEMLRYIDSLPEDPPKARVEIRTRKFWTAIWAEFLATLLLIVVTSASKTDSDVRQSLAVGASTALLTYILHGVAFNPAVTLSRCLVGHASLLKLFASVLVQALSAVLGTLLIIALRSEHHQPSEPKLNLSQIFGVEFLGSLVVVLTVLTSDDDVESGLLRFQAFPVGIAYGAATLFSPLVMLYLEFRLWKCIPLSFLKWQNEERSFILQDLPEACEKHSSKV
ncbi:aquaporin-1-like [Tropilaelaps mercedesae]|uniref:Aquaporin-1-like n=1 Tax=Tropilaelaps mercedesae TaxID=418985 RepID=A0A1V9X2A8_9ACAR|nr:aquaporin-1-like [Tropilaelaps mercedesae]